LHFNYELKIVIFQQIYWLMIIQTDGLTDQPAD